jgi:uncharacterized protein YjbI with pentapeptide repeats
MANPEHVGIFQQGVVAWNDWRTTNPSIFPNLEGVVAKDLDLQKIDLSLGTLTKMNLHFADLQEANLVRAYLVGADLSYAKLQGASLSGANLTSVGFHHADLTGADLSKARLESALLLWANLSAAKLSGAILSWAHLDNAKLGGADLRGASFYHAVCKDADFSGADLSGADFTRAELSGANFSGATLADANLSNASLVETNFENANLTGCRVYGISAWNVKLTGAIQRDIIITPENQQKIQVDRLEIAQFVYLLLNNAEIRHVIDTITSKLVLILGRFTSDRMPVLDGLRNALRQRGYLPVLFDFEKPENRDLTETISTLAHMARFVIADITAARSIPQELSVIVPQLPSVPVQPILLATESEYGMFEHFRRFSWVLPVVLYESQEELLRSLETRVLEPVEMALRNMRK